MAIKSAPQTLINEADASGVTVQAPTTQQRTVEQAAGVPKLAAPAGANILADLIDWVTAKVDENARESLRAARNPADREATVLSWANTYAVDRTWVRSGITTDARREFIRSNRNMVLNGVYAAIL